MSVKGLESLQHTLELTHTWINDLDERLEWLSASLAHAADTDRSARDGGRPKRRSRVTLGGLAAPYDVRFAAHYGLKSDSSDNGMDRLLPPQG